MSDTILQAEGALASSMSTNYGNAVPIPIVTEIERSLLYLLKHRITRVERDAAYEDVLKQAIMDRLPEATFGELISALKMVQQETNNSTGNILKPFIPSSERVPLMDNKESGLNKEAGEIAFQNAPANVLQSLAELNKLLKIIGPKETAPEAGASSTG